MTEKLLNSNQSEKSMIRKAIDSIKFFITKVGGYTIAAFIDFRRSPMTIFFAIAYPLIFTLLFGAIFSDTESTFTYTLYIQAEQDYGYTQNIMGNPVYFNFTDSLINNIQSLNNSKDEQLIKTKYIPLHNEQNKTVNAGKYLEKQEGYIALVIPANMTKKALTSSSLNMTLFVDQNSEFGGTVQKIVTQIIDYLNIQINNILDPMDPVDVKLGMDTTNIYLEEEIEYFKFLVPGMICVTVMNNAVIGVVQKHSYYRKQGLFKKLASSPMNKVDFVTAETTWQFILSWISFLAVVICTYLVFSLPSGETLWIIEILDWKIILIMVLNSICFVGMGMIGGRFVKNPDAAAGAANLLTFPMMFLSGAFFDVSGIPGLNIISKFIPLTYMADALRAVMITGQTNIAWQNIGFGAIFATIFFAIGIIMTKLTDE
ncbi:MAG: ABC transporter permease [Asgard group archaeon]|nr:ABC transporter permease [Asgard group archaeon]